VRACAQFTGTVIGLLVGLGVAAGGVYLSKGTSVWVDVVACLVVVLVLVMAARALSVTYAENRKVALVQQQSAVLGMDPGAQRATTSVATINWMASLSGFLQGGTYRAMG